MLCVGTPWTTRALRLTIDAYYFYVGRPPHIRSVAWKPNSNKPFPDTSFNERVGENVAKTQPPWAVELSNGQRCIGADGATRFIAGERANYICSTSSVYTEHTPVGWIVGEPDKAAERWTVQFLAPGARETEEVAVKAAWY